MTLSQSLLTAWTRCSGAEPAFVPPLCSGIEPVPVSTEGFNPGEGAGQPRRVQLSRRKGWRKPENTIVVARPSKWGNPYPVTRSKRIHPLEAGYTPEQAVKAFRNRMHGLLQIGAIELRELRGKNLACWCRLDQPCHADVLLELANRSDETA